MNASVLPLVALGALITAAPVAAQTPSCIDMEDLTQQQMNRCAAEDFKAADAALNKAWKAVRARFKEIDQYSQRRDGRTETEALIAMQRSWITYRDLACDMEGIHFRGGTMEPLFVDTCKADLTRQQRTLLLGLIEGEPGEQ